MGRNHAVEVHFSGEAVELVAVGVVAAIDIKVMFCDLFRRHVIIGVIGSFCVGGNGHSEECHCRNEESCDCFHSLLGLVDLLLVLFEHDFIAGFEENLHSAQFLVEILAHTVDKPFAHIGSELRPGVGRQVDGTAHRAAHIGTDFRAGHHSPSSWEC